MSWSVSIVGIPEKVNEKLDAYGAGLDGQSKAEFEEARPHLQALVSANAAPGGQMVQLHASGHATLTDGVKQYGNCTVQLTTFYTQLAV